MLHDLSLSLAPDHPIFQQIAKAVPGPFFAGHVGTHLDSLLQSVIPLEWMNREGVLIDARSQAGAEIGLDVLAGIDIQPGDFVIFHSGHIRAHDYGTPAYFADHPQVAWAVIETLLKHQVSFIGIDGPALRRGRDEHLKVDTRCEEQGTYVVENLTNLDGLAATGSARFPLRLGWLSHQGMTGIAMRVVAETPG